MGDAWNLDDIDFDDTGRVVIKNAALARRLVESIAARGGLTLRFSAPQPPPGPHPSTQPLQPPIGVPTLVLQKCPPVPLKTCPNAGCFSGLELVLPMSQYFTLAPGAMTQRDERSELL